MIDKSLWSEIWRMPTIADQQHAMTQSELIAWKAGGRHFAFDAFRKLVEIANPSSLLDVGCGVGHYSEVCRVISPEMKYCGVDVSRSMIATAQTTYKGSFMVCDAASIPFNAKSHDLVSLSAVIGHVPDYDAVIDQAIRLARKHVILHRILSYNNPSEPFREFTKNGYGVQMAERAFDESTLLNSRDWTVVDTVRWNMEATNGYMLSALLKVA